MLNPNSTSGGLAYSEKSKINHDNSKERDALNDGFENEDLDSDEPADTTAERPSSEKASNPPNNKKNDKEQDIPAVKPEKYDDLASSGT